MPEPGRHALVTGGNRGIGRGIAARLLADGYDVTVTSRSPAAGSDAPEGVRVVACDVTDPVSVDAAFTSAEAAAGPVHVLVANAGITHDGLLMRMGEDEFGSVLDTNLAGAWRVLKRASTGMIRARYGRVVLIGSVVGHPERRPGECSGQRADRLTDHISLVSRRDQDRQVLRTHHSDPTAAVRGRPVIGLHRRSEHRRSGPHRQAIHQQRSHLFGPILEHPVTDANHLESGPGHNHVPQAVRFKRRSAAVSPVSVELNREPVIRPGAIDLVPGHGAVHDRQRHIRAPTEREKPELQIGARLAVGLGPFGGRSPKSGDAGSASAGLRRSTKLPPVHDPEPFSLAQHRPDPVLVQPRRKVDHRPDERGHGEAVANREVARFEVATAVNNDPPATSVGGLTSSRSIRSAVTADDLDPIPWLGNTPDRRCAPMRKGGPGSRPQ